MKIQIKRNESDNTLDVSLSLEFGEVDELDVYSFSRLLMNLQREKNLWEGERRVFAFKEQNEQFKKDCRNGRLTDPSCAMRDLKENIVL